ncbi:MAG: energy-coupling factor transporter ATPase [Anaerorhabdus sp.]
MKIIELENVNFSYDKQTPVIKDVSLTVEKGEYTTIIGHNGSGKSTIAKLLIGLLEKDAGNIRVGGLELNLENIQEIRSKVGIVFQNPDNQFIGATVADDIAFGLENRCVQQEEMDGIINEYAKKVSMEDFLQAEPGKLSGGQKQRVAIAGVLAMKPEILIFDEATSMLDPEGKEEIKAMIQEINRDTDITVISITHDIEEVVYSDRVLVMDQGKIMMSGTPEEILVQEEKLVHVNLDIPFGLKIEKAFKKVDIELSKKIDGEGLVDELWQYSLKK